MLEVKNRTPFEAELLPGLDKHGVEHAIVVVKGTFTIRPGKPPEPADEQAPVERADVFHGEPGTSSVKYANDGALRKPGTDVYVVGNAYAPKGLVPFVDVGLRVGAALSKVLRVFGDRIWNRRLGFWVATPPVPFSVMPLVWERAYGGRDPGSKDPARPQLDPRNPVGVGFAARTTGELQGTRLPNLENLRSLVESPGSHPEPMGLGALGANWESRARWAGTMDDKWRKERCPLLPLDFDDRFMQVAPPDQIVAAGLRGGEQVRLLGCNPTGVFELTLPTRKILVSALIRGVEKKQPTVLDTVLVEPDLERVVLTWRASIPCARDFLRTEVVKVEEA